MARVRPVARGHVGPGQRDAGSGGDVAQHQRRGCGSRRLALPDAAHRGSSASCRGHALDNATPLAK